MGSMWQVCCLLFAVCRIHVANRSLQKCKVLARKKEIQANYFFFFLILKVEKDLDGGGYF